VPLGERVGVDEPLEVEEPLLVRDRVGLGVQEAVLVTEGLAPGDRDGEALLVSDVVSVRTYTLRMRWLSRSATMTLPLLSTATPRG
jgi:hypothetical protein